MANQQGLTTGHDATAERQGRETHEGMPYAEVRRGLDELAHASDQTHERVSDTADLNEMLELRADRNPEAQAAGICLIESKLINVIAKIGKAHPENNFKRMLPGELMRDAQMVGAEVTPEESMAWQKYIELIGQPGPTSSYLLKAWAGEDGQGGMIEQGEYASKGFVGKLGKFAHDHPGQTLVYAAAGAAGVYLGYKLLKGIWGWFNKEEKDDGSPKEGFFASLVPSKKTALAFAALAAGLVMGREGLKELMMKMAPDEIRELIEKGEALPEKVRKELEETRAEVEKLKGQIQGAGAKAAEVTGEVAGEAKEIAMKVSNDREPVIQMLVRLYAIEQVELPEEMQGKILAAMRGDLAHLSLQKIAETYRKHEGEKTIDPKAFGLSSGDPEALFHAAQIITRARDYYVGHYPKIPVDGMTLDVFLTQHLAHDPATALHDAFLGQLKQLDLSSLADLNGNKLAELLSEKKLNELFTQNIGSYIETMAQRLGVEVPAAEKKEFLGAALFLYGGKINLNTSTEDLDKQLPPALSPTVREATIRFFKAIQTQTTENLEGVFRRYDIHRQEGGDLDNVLRNSLKIKDMLFSQGLELSVLSQGMQWEAPDGGDFDKAKDVAMVMLISKILKEVKPDAHAWYMSNVAGVLAGTIHAPNFNLCWKFLQPYMKFGLTQVVKRVGQKVEYGLQFARGLARPSDNKQEFFETIKDADWLKFSGIFGMEAAAGTISIPKRLAVTLYEKFGDVFFNEATDGVSILNMITALSGTLIYSQTKGGENSGVVYLAGEYFLLHPAGIVWDTLRGKLHGVGIKTYGAETAPYIMIGALAGLARADSGILAKATGMLKGAGRGLAAPITAPIAGYRAARETYRIGGRIVSLMRYQGTGDMALLRKSAALFAKYDDLTESVISPIQAIKHPLSHGRKIVYQDLYRAYRERWGDYFIRDYNDLFGYNPDDPAKSGKFRGIDRKPHEDLAAYTGKARRINKFMEEVKKLDVESMDAKGVELELRRIAALPAEDVVEAGDAFVLETRELNRLIELHAKDGFEKFKRMIILAKKESFTQKAGRALGALRERVGARGSEWLEDQKWYQDFEKWRGAKFTGEDLAVLAKSDQTEEGIATFLKAKKIAPDVAERMAVRIIEAKDAKDVERIIAETAEAENLTVKFAPEIARWLKLGRWAGALGTAAGVAIYGVQAYQAFSEAGRTSDAERKNILLQKGSLYGANVAADTAGLYAMGSAAVTGVAAEGVAATLGAVAMPLVPGTYMAEAALESKYEATKTVAEWAREEPRQLIHDWISTSTEGAGEAYRLFADAKEIGREKQETIRRMAAAIVCQEDMSQAPNPDRLYYLEVTCHTRPPVNFHEALDFLRDSHMYANLMAQRRQTGGLVDEKPSAQAIEDMLQTAKTESLAQLNPDLKKNWDAFSTRYLIDLACKAFALEHGQKANDAEKQFADQLESYLTFVRGVDMSREYMAWLAEKSQKRELDDSGKAKIQKEAQEAIAQLLNDPSRSLRGDLEHQTPSRAVYALADLGRFFGYTGYPNEDALKGFFDEAHKGAHGCYWNGDEWCLNEAGYERDEHLGKNLSETTVRQMIKLMRDDPDDVLESRQDALVDIGSSAVSFKEQVGQMAMILENGLKKEPPKFQKLEAIESEPLLAT